MSIEMHLPYPVFSMDKSKAEYRAHHRFSFDDFYTIIYLDDRDGLVLNMFIFLDIIVL